MAPKRAARLPRWSLVVLLLLPPAGCHGGRQGGQLAPADSAPYTAARPTYGPRPLNPLFISGYAGRRPNAPPARPFSAAPESFAEPSLLP